LKFDEYPSLIRKLVRLQLGESSIKNYKTLTESISPSLMTYRSINFFIRAAHPEKRNDEYPALVEEVCLAMYNSGFDSIPGVVEQLHDEFERRKQMCNLYPSFEDFYKTSFNKWVFTREDFLEWYREVWEEYPDDVDLEMKHVKAFLRAARNPRKNPFTISISHQYVMFENYQHLNCFEELPNEVLTIIIEFHIGKEKSLSGLI